MSRCTTSRALTRWWPAAALALIGCGGDPPALQVNFLDELVEAPARTVQAVVVDDADCATVLSVRHEEISTVGNVVAEATTSYPVSPDLDLFADIARGTAITVAVVVHDTSDRIVSRGCAEATLTDGQGILLEMHGFPVCTSAAKNLDLAIVLDVSVGMRDADITLGNAVLEETERFVSNMGLPNGAVRFALVTHGDDGAKVEVPLTTGRDVVEQRLNALQGFSTGDAEHFLGLREAALHLKDSMACGRRPAMLWLGGGADTSASTDFDLALIDVVGTRGERRDDIYVHAIGVSDPAVSAMRELIDRIELGAVEGAATANGLRGALVSASTGFQSLFP